MPARAILDHPQAKFTQRLSSRPSGHQGPEEVMTRRDSKITNRLRAAIALRSEETAEGQSGEGSGLSQDGQHSKGKRRL